MITTVGTPLGFSFVGNGYEPPPVDALIVSKKINPVTGDYDTSAGVSIEENPVATRVLLACSQVPGDLDFDRDFGDRSNLVDRDSVDLKNKILSYVQDALSPMIKEGLIELLGVSVTVAPGVFGRVVLWKLIGEEYARQTPIS